MLSNINLDLITASRVWRHKVPQVWVKLLTLFTVSKIFDLFADFYCIKFFFGGKQDVIDIFKELKLKNLKEIQTLGKFNAICMMVQKKRR